MSDSVVIIGTGLAGYQLAKDFRKIAPETPLTIVTADEGHYYSKPLLSTALTSGKTAATLAIATAEAMATQLNAAIGVNAHVSSINPEQKNITINDEKISYSKLVLACGADVIKPPLAGNAADKIVYVNHIYHYSDFRDLLLNKKRIVILGAGLIGCEFANDLSNAGFEVHLIAPVPAPLDLLVPTDIGKVLQAALMANGVHFHLPAVAERIDKTAHGTYNLELSNGTELEAELVLSAIGLKPHVELAKTADIKIDRGILVNRFLETSQPDIYALGDCAEVEGHVLPYIAPLLSCSRALAKTLAGTKTAVEYPAMPVVVKTPAHPIIVCPPPRFVPGEWKISNDENNYRALFYNTQNQLLGFVLTNAAVKERAALVKQLPPLF